MIDILNDIQDLEKIKKFMLQAIITNDESEANLQVAIDKITTVIKNKEHIITDFSKTE